MRVAEAGFYRIFFSQEILDGATRNLVKDGRMDVEKAAKFHSVLLTAFPEALVSIPDGLAEVMTNDPGDRHVLAAAVACRAEIIVTFNLKHFRTDALDPWSVEAQHPDTFLTNLCDLYGTESLAQVIRAQAADLKRPPMTVLELLAKLNPQVPNFTQQIVTSCYGQEVKRVARKLLDTPLAKRVDFNRIHCTGNRYDIYLVSGRLTIVDKDSRNTVLEDRSGCLEGSLTPEDTRRFLELGKCLNDYLELS